MNSSLRIAWVVYGSLNQVSGGYIYDRLVVERLLEIGDQVSIVSLVPGLEPSPIDASAIDVVVADELCFREIPALFAALPERVRRILLVHHLTAWEHDAGAPREEILAVERRAISAAHACVATSRVTADRLEQEGLARRVAVAEPGADRLERAASAGQETGGARLRFLFVGNVLPRKRVLELARAFAELDTEQAELVLVGAELEPRYAQEVRELVARAGKAHLVRWLGALDAAGVAEQFSLADALVLPSILEGYGMVLSEALWCSVPIIAARVGAASELVYRSGAGLLFEPHDVEGLATALRTFVSDRGLRAKLRHAAWHSAAELPRWHDTALALRATLCQSH